MEKILVTEWARPMGVDGHEIHAFEPQKSVECANPQRPVLGLRQRHHGARDDAILDPPSALLVLREDAV
jgi:hypothetical protein